MSPLAPILQEYFTAYLVTQRAMSQATIRAYRDTWRLLLTFLSGIMQVPAHQLQLTEPPWVDERLLIQQGDWSHVRSPQVR